MAAIAGAATLEPRDSSHLHSALEAISRAAWELSPAGRIETMLRVCGPHRSRVIRDFMTAAAACGREVTTIKHLAQQLGVSVRTIERHLFEDRLPAAHEIFWTIAVYRAVFALQDPNCTLKRIAALLPFVSESAVSLRFRRYIGARPGELRQTSMHRAIHKTVERRLATWLRAMPSDEYSKEPGARAPATLSFFERISPREVARSL